MTRRNNYRILFAAICLSLSAAVTAKMYKWTDEQGNTHYTQVPPPGQAAREMAPPPRVNPPELQGGNHAQAKSAEDKASDGAPSDDLTPEQQAERKQLYQRNCEAARKNLKLFEHARRIMEKGELVVLTQEERTRRSEEARQQIEKYCNQ